MRVQIAHCVAGIFFGAVLVATPALAIVVDGTVDPEYGSALSTQGVQTHFGDASLGQVNFCDGSELDAAYAVIEDGNLYLLLAGNLESNFNKMEIFIDCIEGGQNRIRSDAAILHDNALARMGELWGGDGSFGPDGPGLKFDVGLEPDFYLTVMGIEDTGQYLLWAMYAELLTEGGGIGLYLGQGDAVTDGTLLGGENPHGIRVTINNSNTVGVGPGCAGDSGDAVLTGIELQVPLVALGEPTGCLRITAFINGRFHDWVSNQVLGSLVPDQCNLEEPRLVDFASLPGDQYFEVCPPPVQVEDETWGRIKAHTR